MNTLARLAVVALAFATAGCIHIHLPAKHTPAPGPLVTNAASPGQRAAVLAYAATLQFDTITHGASDIQPLTLKDSAAGKDTVGPVGTIYPEKNTHRNSQADLAGVGRIVARIYSTGAYPRIGLAAGWSYYWVDSLVMITPDSGVGRALLIPADSSQPITVRVMTYTTDPPGGAHEKQAMARWRYYPLQSALPWERCTKMGCCEAQ